MSLRTRLGESLRQRACDHVAKALIARVEGRHVDTIAPLAKASALSFACALLGVRPLVANDVTAEADDSLGA